MPFIIPKEKQLGMLEFCNEEYISCFRVSRTVSVDQLYHVSVVPKLWLGLGFFHDIF